MKSIQMGATTLSYDEAGEVLQMLLSGWYQDHRLFMTLVPELNWSSMCA